MADIALDADGLRRDRQRYHALLEQAELQIAAWNERADHLQQAIDGLDRLLALSGDDPAQDGGVPRGRASSRGVPTLPEAAPAPAPTTEAGPTVKKPAPDRADKPKVKVKAAAAKKAAARPAAATPPPPPPTAEPVAPPAGSVAESPKGTDALRVVFESTPERTWSLAELIDALGTRGWLPTSRRPEEGVRISLKRLAERGGVVRTDDGRWRLATAEAGAASDPEAPWPPADPPPAPDAPAAQAAPAVEQANPAPPVRATPVPPPNRPASYGRPVGGTVTEV